jgi:hypothetical protein
MSRTLRPLAALAMVALISVISAGCGSNAPSETGTASGSGTSKTSLSRPSLGCPRQRTISASTESRKPINSPEQPVRTAPCSRITWRLRRVRIRASSRPSARRSCRWRCGR